MATLQRSADELTDHLQATFPPADGQAGISVEHLDDTTIRLRMPVDGRRLRPGDTVSGPTMFSMVDAVAWLLTLAHLPPGREAVTANLTMNFLRRPQPLDLIGEGRLLRMGSRFSVTDVVLHSDGVDDPVAQATVTYAPV